MALFGFFKNTNPASEKEVSKERAEDIIETPIVPRQEVRIEPAQRIGAGPSGIKKAETRTIKEPNSNEGERPEKRNDNSVSRIFWPRYGTQIDELVSNRQIRVFVDAAFISSDKFGIFSDRWRAGKGAGNVGNVYFVPGFEKAKLTSEQKQSLKNGDYKEWYSTSFEECFKSFHDRNVRCAIIFLTTSMENGLVAQKAAREANANMRWYGLDANGCICSLSTGEKAPHSKEIAEKKVFQWTDQMVRISKRPSPSRVPGQGETVIANSNKAMFRLMKPLMSNHNSITYSTSNGEYCAKIYTVANLQIDIWENKADRMIRERVQIPGVCWPMDKLMNESGQFVGILVPTAQGIQLTRSVFNGATGMSQAFPGWKREDLCTLADTILTIVMQMHKAGIYFGCLNPATIYIVNPKEVYLVDSDSWQIEGYPAVSRNRTFTPPELIKTGSKQAFFTPDQEYYQIALLVFMIMMPGKFPYALRKSDSEEESIAEKSFAFGIGSNMRRSRDAERPQGVWRIAWDHLPYSMCNLFYSTFHANGKYSAPGTRPNDYEWRRAINGYLKELDGNNSSDSHNVFPKTFRRDGKRVFARCSVCGQEHPEFYFLKNLYVNKQKVDVWSMGYRICLPCAEDKSDVSFTCKCCDRKYFYTNRTKLMHAIGKSEFGWANQKWCGSCKKRTTKCSGCGKEIPIYQMREFTDKKRNLTRTVCSDCFGSLINQAKKEQEAWKNSVHTDGRCRICGRSFTITNGEAEFFSKKGFDLPTKCPNCRGKR